MFFIILVLAVMIFAFAGAGRNININCGNGHKIFWVILLTGFFVRILCAGLYYGHETDVTDFLAWSDMLYKDGIPAFYESDTFTDYPPGYMYILWIIGFIKNTFSLSGAGGLILIKLPAIIADLLCGVLVYRTAKKRGMSPYLLSALFIFNPAIILNSTIWGQADSVTAICVTLMIFILTEEKVKWAYPVFALAVFIKPQALMFTPVLMYAFYEEFKAKRILENIIYIILSAVGMFLLAYPFGVSNVISQYIQTLDSYPYATINAFNFWGAMGMNWEELNTVTSAIGGLFLVFITIAALVIMKKSHNKAGYFYGGAFLCFASFMLSVKMHERYAYPAMLLMLMAFVFSGDFRNYKLYTMLSLSQFFNTAYILFVYETNPSLYFKSPVIIVASIINLAILFYFAYASDKREEPLKLPERKEVRLERTENLSKISGKDFIIMGIITLVYGCIAFYALGDNYAPRTEYVFSPETSTTIRLEEPQSIEKIRYYMGARPLEEERVMTVELLDENDDVIKSWTEDDSAVFFWSEAEAEGERASAVRLSVNEETGIFELAVIGVNNEILKISNSDELSGLCDEQNLVPQEETYMNSTYFDEIYHARTGYEFINKLPVYEWTHPPLGKVFISWGIRLFGMTPFGWRCVGVLFGILMVPVFYIFAKLITKKSWLSAVATVLFTFDFMHYTQTRIATIDVYVTFFIMLMYLFMYVYQSKSFYDTRLGKTFRSLGLSGIFMGLAIASKWTGMYAATGLAVIFFMTLFRRWREYSHFRNGDVRNFKAYTTRTILFCLMFFVLIPVGIYVLSYIPYLIANGEGIKGIWENQMSIFTYHSSTVLDSTHAFSSPWYTWPVMSRPIWYYSNMFADGKAAGISAFGNPLVWWVGIASAIFCIIYAMKNKDKTALFLVIAYASNFLPWAAIERTTFIYHYFPSVPFVVLMTGYMLSVLYKKHKWIKSAAFIYAICAVALFIGFYPVLTGTPVNPQYVETYLKWLPGWVLI